MRPIKIRVVIKAIYVDWVHQYRVQEEFEGISRPIATCFYKKDAELVAKAHRQRKRKAKSKTAPHKTKP